MYVKKEEVYPAFVSKHYSNCEKHFLKVSNREGWHYLAVKNWRTTSKNNGDFYSLNCFHSFRTKSKLKSHKKVCENKDFCNVIMHSEDTEIV